MQEFLVFRPNEDGEFPATTNEVIFGNPEIYKDEAVLLVPWETVGGDRLATNYVYDGNKLIYSPPPPHEPAYTELRQAEYAKIPVGDQLDAIYKYALANGVVPDPNAKTDTPEGWVAKIQSIKETYPKPE